MKIVSPQMRKKQRLFYVFMIKKYISYIIFIQLNFLIKIFRRFNPNLLSIKGLDYLIYLDQIFKINDSVISKNLNKLNILVQELEGNKDLLLCQNIGGKLTNRRYMGYGKILYITNTLIVVRHEEGSLNEEHVDAIYLKSELVKI